MNTRPKAFLKQQQQQQNRQEGRGQEDFPRHKRLPPGLEPLISRTSPKFWRRTQGTDAVFQLKMLCNVNMLSALQRIVLPTMTNVPRISNVRDKEAGALTQSPSCSFISSHWFWENGRAVSHQVPQRGRETTNLKRQMVRGDSFGNSIMEAAVSHSLVGHICGLTS